MNIPNLPTDNLYKFISIFGLILFGFSIYLSNLYLDDRHEINKDFSNYLVDADNTEKEYNLALTSYDSIGNIIIQLEKLERFNSIKLEKAFQDYYRDRIIKYGIQWNNEAIEGAKLLKRLEYNEKKQKVYGDEADILRLIGSVLMVIGFLFWYFKHQIYIDAEIKWKGEIYSKLLNDEAEKKRIINAIVDNNSVDKPKD